MRCLKISFNTLEDKAGTLLADLVEKGVANLEFHVVEDMPFTRNASPAKPRAKRAVKPTMQGSAIPEMMQKAGVLKGKQLDIGQVRKVLVENGLSPTSYSHALILLQNRGLIRKTDERGIYEII